MDDWELKISEVDETSRDIEERKVLAALLALSIREATADVTKAKRGQGVQQERKIEAIFWLFHESTEPWSAWWVTSHLGIDLKHIRHVVKNRPAQLRSALQYRQRTKAA